MNWLRWLFPPGLPPELRRRKELVRRQAGQDLTGDWRTVNLVVLDVETTGLNPGRDHLLSVGAVKVAKGRMQTGRTFHGILAHTPEPQRENVLIHGITREMQRGGEAPESLLMDFLEYVGSSPWIAYHAPFDRAFLRRAFRSHLGMGFNNPALDLAWLLPGLLPDLQPRPAGLDGWLANFGITIGRRHSALDDALATAELLLVALHHAERQGITTFGRLREIAESESALHANRSRGVH